MNLPPPIPDEAVLAAIGLQLIEDEVPTRDILAAAYPHLAAAVLRWAAGEVTPDRLAEQSVSIVHPERAIWADRASVLLRRLADEVAP